MTQQQTPCDTPLIKSSETPLTDHEDEQNDQKSQSESNTNGKSKNGNTLSIDVWISRYKLEHLKQCLIKHKLFSVEKLQQLALTHNFQQTIDDVVKDCTIAMANVKEESDTKHNFEIGLNMLLINNLGKTNDFLSKLKELCQTDTKNDMKDKNTNDKEWVLILIDCDDIGVLLYNKKVSMVQAQNSINLLNASICRIVEESVACGGDEDNKNSGIFGYHLGSDLFALFVEDNAITMNKSIEISESLLNIMQNKEKSSFTISVGLGIRKLKLSQNGKDDKDDTKEKDGIKSIRQREWVLSAHINLLRAKENGKNCYFKLENKIDSRKDNKELIKLRPKVNLLYNELYIEECEHLVDDILDKYDENTLVNQTVTTEDKENLRSIHLMKALIIFYRKRHIGNVKYRAWAAKKWIDLCMKTFILGNMTIECYYYYKLFAVEIEDGLDPTIRDTRNEILQQADARINDCDTTNDDFFNYSITKEYDITLLTRKRNCDAVVRPVIKHSSLYYSKRAFEHLDDTSEAPLIGLGFGFDVGYLGRQAYNYERELYEEVIKLDPHYGMARINLVYTLWSMEKYKDCLNFIEKAVKEKVVANNTWFLWTAGIKYRQSCQKHIDKKMTGDDNDCDNDDNADNDGDDNNNNDANINIVKMKTKDERLAKAIEYGEKMMDIVTKENKWIRSEMYIFYGSLLYAWSKDFDKNREQQRTALKMYEKGIKMDQQLGFDIINNWISDFDQFEHELINIIIRYWYLPVKSMQRSVLDCADLIETYFNHHDEKMKYAKMLSGIVPDGGNIRRVLATDITGKRACYYVSIRKPAIYDQAIHSDTPSFNFENFGSVVASWYLDEGNGHNNINTNETNIQFTRSFAAKLAYFFTFWIDYKDFISKELGLTIELIKELRIIMIRLLIHYAFKLNELEHRNFSTMIGNSTNMTNIVQKFYYQLPFFEIASTCEKIEKKIDLQDEKVILNMSTIISPYIVTKNKK